MGRLGRVLAGLAALPLLAVACVGGALWWSLPPHRLHMRLPGLAAPVAISLDADGIPRIRAGSAEDAAAALGLMHARDRLFQMDLMRRAASGRLSELAGAATLPLDRANRLLGLRRRAEADLPGLDAPTRRLLEAYARGVNAWIGRRGRFAAPEFIAFGAPEPWTPVDSLLWGKTMALYLAGNWRAELWRAALQARLPPAIAAALWPDRADTPRPDASRLVPAPAPARLAAAMPGFPAPFTLPESASNEWAVDGRFSASGAPLLAGDPHLAYGMPGIWYLARLDWPGSTLAGATAPGVPFLVLGHNGHVAWTFTTTGADTQDVFIETPVAGGYATPDGPRPFLTRSERIAVRGAADTVFTARETRHGPVVSDLDGARSGPVLAVAMASLLPDDTAAAGLAALNRAATLDAAGHAAALISAPVQNLLVADAGGIARYTTGRVPIRRGGDGSVPVDGADGAHDWTGVAAGMALPHEVAPASGRLVNANERIAGPDFPVFLGRDWFGDWRARRIRELLAARPLHDAASFASMQVDVVSSFARQVLPALLAIPAPDAGSGRALDALRHWDGGMRADAPQPLIFNAWMRRFEAALRAQSGLGEAPLGPPADLIGQALAPAGGALCGAGCQPLLQTALAEAVAELARAHGPNWDRTPWGSVHQAAFAHPLLGRIPGLQALFTWRIAQPGDDTTVFRGTPRAPGWESVHGPAFRGVYDLAGLDASRFALAPGESGHPLLGADATLRRWRDGTALQLGRDANVIADNIALEP